MDEDEKLMDIVRKVTNELKSDESFYVCDFSDVIKKFEHWKIRLPRVHPYYAIKSNAEEPFLRFMLSLGVGFDCSNKDEIDWVLSLGASPSQIIFAHTFKMPSHLKYVKEIGVDLMTFDSEGELYKIKEHFPNARLVLRFRVPDVESEFVLGNKFGCELSECRELLKVAQELNLLVVGTCFHVGGLCSDPSAFSKAIKMSKEIFDMAEDFGYKLSLLDIGGGFSGHLKCYEEFDEMCHSINQALEEHFPENDEVSIIAEPGTYFAGSAFTLCTYILGKKKSKNETESKEFQEKIAYYLNDGIYGSFFYKYECYKIEVKPLLTNLELKLRPIMPTKLWGFTCCSEDYIKNFIMFPEMNIGEYIIFTNMGAYTLNLISNFNGFPKPAVQYIFSGKKTVVNWNGIEVNGILPSLEKKNAFCGKK